MHENLEIDLDMQDLENIYNNIRNEQKSHFTAHYEKQLIAKIQETDWSEAFPFVPENFDWASKIPFRKNLSIDELSSIEQGLNSENLQQRCEALRDFIDIKLLTVRQVISLEKEMIEKMAGFFNSAISPSFQERLKDNIHQACCQVYLNYIQNGDNFEQEPTLSGRILAKNEKDNK